MNTPSEPVKEQIDRELTCDERIDIASTIINFDPLEFGVGIDVSDESIHRVCDLYGVPRRTTEPYSVPQSILAKAITIADEREPS